MLFLNNSSEKFSITLGSYFYALIYVSNFVHSGNKQIEAPKQGEYLGNSRK